MTTPRPRGRAALAVFGAAVLLLAGHMHLAHFCIPPATTSQPSLGSADRSSTHMPCLMCISLHAPSRAAPAVSVFPVGDSSAVTVALQPAFRSGVQGFALYIRPPPAA
jgi:tRNA(Arg) A34 adenosine deaminase TadA